MPNLDIQQHFNLTDKQAAAATVRGIDVILTAGAGSGKTRTLVARYISLLAEGLQPPHTVAITFTEKAAREMRSRLREELAKLRRETADPSEAQFWRQLESQMDSARIGTIHSLCAEILRSHPAEAGVDPLFDVLDEGRAAALRQRILEEALAEATELPELQPLFDGFTVRGLQKILPFALARRLDLLEWLQQDTDPGHPPLLRRAVEAFLEHPVTAQIVTDFRQMRDEDTMLEDAGPKLTEQLENLLTVWDECRRALENDDLNGALKALQELRGHMDGRAGSRGSLCKQDLKQLRQLYDDEIGKWLKEAPDPEAEDAFRELSPLLSRLFELTIQRYRSALDRIRALDFDDLEGWALELLQKPHVQRRWQAEVQALLVDEFQDTNGRQRRIVEFLSQERFGKLFVVGDERQSIYRFRGADVTVFRSMRRRIQNAGGEALSIERTFRTHADLLGATGELLEPAMQADADPPPDYWVAYTALEADRQTPRDGTQAPHIEFVVGVGEDSDSGRTVAARLLAARLLELQAEGQIQSWEDVALLFRASTHFDKYEDALERAGIPYVTIAGRGFYDRPEVRDVLNLLRALADPWDDLALAGLLRSPAIGLSDAALYHLRWPNGPGASPLSYRQALHGDLVQLGESDRQMAQRARSFLEELSPLVERMPAAELLDLVLERTDYRAALASGNPSGGGGAASRLWRNLDKLLEDAQTSRITGVGEFLEYIGSLRDVGAREGEAPLEAEGALQIMTMHKSKGLEFPFVVIADAAYSPRNLGEPAYLLSETGLAFKPDRMESEPLAYGFVKNMDKKQSDAEDKRLLYVAATRAQEKLLISGHYGSRASGWLKDLAKFAGFDLKQLVEQAGQHTQTLPNGRQVSLWVADAESLPERTAQPDLSVSSTPHAEAHLSGDRDVPLYSPPESPEPDETEPEPEANWRASGTPALPASIIGELAHRALQRWLFPPDPRLEPLLDSVAYNLGLVDEAQRSQALERVKTLLARLAAHRLKTEIDAAAERRHEIPYSAGERAGKIDLLYRAPSGWQIVDFKTESIQTPFDLQNAVESHRPQLQLYTRAVASLLGETPNARLCFLDYMGAVHLEPLLEGR